jgi:hypothetical protein
MKLTKLLSETRQRKIVAVKHKSVDERVNARFPFLFRFLYLVDRSTQKPPGQGTALVILQETSQAHRTPFKISTSAAILDNATWGFQTHVGMFSTHATGEVKSTKKDAVESACRFLIRLLEDKYPIIYSVCKARGNRVKSINRHDDFLSALSTSWDPRVHTLEAEELNDIGTRRELHAKCLSVGLASRTHPVYKTRVYVSLRNIPLDDIIVSIYHHRIGCLQEYQVVFPKNWTPPPEVAVRSFGRMVWVPEE